MNSRALVTLLREGFPEVEISGELLVWSGEKIIFQNVDSISAFPARSLLKPFQFLATLRDNGDAVPEWRVPALGSISSDEEQSTKIRKWLSDSNRSDLLKKMVLKAGYPWDESHRAKLKWELKEPSILYHTCFSKHLNILDFCREEKWDLNDYSSVDSPFHKKLVSVLVGVLERDLSGIPWVKDGCGLPTPVLALKDVAQLFQKLANATADTPLARVRDLMLQFPEWIGGPHRMDSQLVTLNKGRVVAKEGADGLLAMGIRGSQEFPGGLGIVLKLASGYNSQWAGLALKPLLDYLEIHHQSGFKTDQKTQFHYQGFLNSLPRIFDISPVLSEKTAVWPGDIPFKREVSLDVQLGNHMSLSHFQTTVHVGSHTDAPNHFEKNKIGIDEVELEKYHGLCMVIEITIPRGHEIKVTDLKNREIVAKRVLFKTGSFPDPYQFGTDFNSLSAELVEFLREKGVCLVGIDTPSIDLFDSKDLLSHHETLKSEMAILEGIDLSGVPEGVYELIALPLKIKSGDASPVRAILVSNQCPSEFGRPKAPEKISFSK